LPRKRKSINQKFEIRRKWEKKS